MNNKFYTCDPFNEDDSIHNPKLLDCNSLELVMKNLKKNFESCKELKADDLDTLVDVLHSAQICNECEDCASIDIGVETVNGIGVNNTDVKNPIINIPQNLSDLFNDSDFITLLDIEYINAAIISLGDIKADKDDVLEKDNTTTYTPFLDYHPATKKYVDDNAGGGGSAFIKEGGGVPTPVDNKYTSANNGFGGIETPTSPIHNTGKLRQQGKGQANGIDFDTQTLHSLGINDLSHLTIQQKEANTGTRFYLMPKGTIPSADSLASGIKIFSTDYEADGTNYHDWGMWSTQNELISNSKRNGTFANNLPFVWKYQDTNKILKLQAKANAALMLGVSASEEKDWTLFNPLHLGSTTVLLGREGANASEFINNAYFDGSWKRIMDGYSHRQSMSTDGSVTYWSGGTGVAGSTVTWVKTLLIKPNGVVNTPTLPTYANDGAAGTDGLVAGDQYKTSTGEMRIKL